MTDKAIVSDEPAIAPGSVLDALGHADRPQTGSVLQALGHDTSASKLPPDAPKGAIDFVELPGTGVKHYIDSKGKFIRQSQPAASNAVGDFIGDLPRRYSAATKGAFRQGTDTAYSGWRDIRNSSPATGVPKVALGHLGQVFAPLSGMLDLGAEEVDSLTGVPGTGNKVNMLLPFSKVGPIATKLMPTRNALSTIVRDIGPENALSVADRLERNPTLSLMDVHPGVQSRAIAIAKGEPSQGQTHLFEEAARRVDERRAQTTGAFSSTIGPPPDTVALLGKMKTDAANVGKTQIQPALAGAKPVDVSGVVGAIDAEIGAPTIRALRDGKPLPLPLSPIQQRLLQLRKDLTYRGAEGELFPAKPQMFIDATTNPVAGAKDAGAHGIQSRLRYEAETLMNSNGSDRLMGGTLHDFRQKLVSAIDKAAGGKYRPALEAYRDEMHVQEAFDKGYSILSGARVGEAGLENRPEAWANWINKLPPKVRERELEAARLGGRVAVDNTIGTIRQAGRAGADIPDAPFTRAKFEMLYGKEETKRLAQILADEKAKAETNTLLTKQSVTARALASQKQTAPRDIEPIGAHAQRLLPAALLEATQPMISNALGLGGLPGAGYPGLASAGLIGYGLARKTGQKVGRAHDIATNDAYAHLASTTIPKERNALIDTIRAHAEPIGQGNKATNMLRLLGDLPLPR